MSLHIYTHKKELIGIDDADSNDADVSISKRKYVSRRSSHQ